MLDHVGDGLRVRGELAVVLREPDGPLPPIKVRFRKPPPPAPEKDKEKPARKVSPVPPVLLDVALVVDERVPVAEVADALRAGGGELLEDLNLFDVFTGEQVGAGRKSLALAKTLSEPLLPRSQSGFVAEQRRGYRKLTFCLLVPAPFSLCLGQAQHLQLAYRTASPVSFTIRDNLGECLAPWSRAERPASMPSSVDPTTSMTPRC